MKIQIRTFGAVTDHLQDHEVEVEEGMTLRDLKHELLEKHPALGKQFFRLAIGTRMAEDDTELMDGDEVSLMPPFAGG